MKKFRISLLIFSLLTSIGYSYDESLVDIISDKNGLVNDIVDSYIKEKDIRNLSFLEENNQKLKLNNDHFKKLLKEYKRTKEINLLDFLYSQKNHFKFDEVNLTENELNTLIDFHVINYKRLDRVMSDLLKMKDGKVKILDYVNHHPDNHPFPHLYKESSFPQSKTSMPPVLEIPEKGSYNFDFIRHNMQLLSGQDLDKIYNKLDMSDEEMKAFGRFIISHYEILKEENSYVIDKGMDKRKIFGSILLLLNVATHGVLYQSGLGDLYQSVMPIVGGASFYTFINSSSFDEVARARASAQTNLLKVLDIYMKHFESKPLSKESYDHLSRMQDTFYYYDNFFHKINLFFEEQNKKYGSTLDFVKIKKSKSCSVLLGALRARR